MTKKKKTLRAKVLASIFAMLICGCSNSAWGSNYVPSTESGGAEIFVTYSAKAYDGHYKFDVFTSREDIIDGTTLLLKMNGADWANWYTTTENGSSIAYSTSDYYKTIGTPLTGSNNFDDIDSNMDVSHGGVIKKFKVAGGYVYGIEISGKYICNLNPYNTKTVKVGDTTYTIPHARPDEANWRPWDQVEYYAQLEMAAEFTAMESERRVQQDDLLHLDDVSGISHTIDKENKKLVTTIYNNEKANGEFSVIGTAELPLDELKKVIDTNTQYKIEVVEKGENDPANTIKKYELKDAEETLVGTVLDTDTKYTIGAVEKGENDSANTIKKYELKDAEGTLVGTVLDTDTKYTIGVVEKGENDPANTIKKYEFKDAEGTLVGTVLDTDTTYTLGTEEGEKGTNYTITGTDGRKMIITDTHLVSNNEALLFNKETGDLTFTVTDTGGNKVAGSVNIAEYVGSVAQANDTDTHIKDGSYKVGAQGVADAILINIVDKNGDATGKQVELTDIASATDLRIESAQRQAEDASLSNRIIQEAAERQAEDASLSNRIIQEAAERQAEDASLSNRIIQEAEERIANDIVSGNITNGTVTLTKGNGGTITVGNICDSRLDSVSYDSNSGNMIFTVKDHYNNDKENVITVKDIASKYNLDKLTETVGVSTTTELTTEYENTTYIKEATNMVEADKKLDEAIKNEEAARIAGDNMITNRLNKLGNRVDKVGAGAAALAALHPLDFDPYDKLSFSAGVGNYGGETATALGMFYRPTEKVMLSAAGTMGNGENMVNMGVTFALDKTNNVSNSRVAMAREIQDLREQVAALTALVTQLAGRSNPALQDVVMFPDVPENHWAYDYIEGLQKRGIVEGYPDGNFAGDRSMTRYEYAAMLYRALEKGFPVDTRLLDEFEAELGRIRIDRIKGLDDDANKVERVRVNQYEDRDDYGSKLVAVNAVKQ